ncbi:MAG: cysteine desulfurase [Bacteroidota bacterium]|nr:cysteine desulfurase [Bacteroidota bacterium]MDP4273446.1 cysteine desulfurase [Bacteroidota bacterium]
MFDVKKIREDFPILKQQVYGHPLVYFDNGATTQKPNVVIDAVSDFYRTSYSTIHRGVHYLSEQATEAYEGAREKIQHFINAEYSQEIIFTSGATGSLNAFAFSFGEKYIHEGDEIIISAMEHHSNLVPWQMLCQRKKAKLKFIPFNDDGVLDQEAYHNLFTDKTKLVSVVHVSNTLGTINPVKEMVEYAHQHGALVMLDGAQAIQHQDIDVRDLNCDFYAFSGHKIYGPTGIGILYGKEKYLNEMPPYQGGGDMVDCVTLENTTYNDLPFKFEAGTTNFVGAIGLGVAIDYVNSVGIADIHAWENELLQYATKKLKKVEGLRIYGNSPDKACILSFLMGDIHPYDVGMVLDKMGVAVRTGTHCTQPIMDHFNIEGTLRASLAFYNTKEEIDILYDALLKAKKMFE